MTPVHECIAAKPDGPGVSAEQNAMRSAIVVEASAVAESALTDKRPFDTWGPEYYPNATPPFASFAVVWQVPGYCLPPGMRSPFFMVVLCRAWPIREMPDGALKRRLPASTAHAIVMSAWNVSRHRPRCCGWRPVVAVNSLGHVACVLSAPGIGADDISGVIQTPLMTLSLMHCRNIRTRDISAERNPLPQTLRKMKLPRLTFKTLVIDPVRGGADGGDGVSEGESLRAEHLVRGHHARYSEDRPLFGRHGMHGLFWVGPHIRGERKNGLVIKDYSVKAPV